MRIFVTGGAGYIGSHVVKLLGEKGHEIIVFDDLSSGHKSAILYGTLVRGDLSDKLLLNDTIKRFRPDAVMHFAAYIQVEESVKEPLKYYRNNTMNTMNLLEVMMVNNVSNLIFSSTAAVYGIPNTVPVNETSPLNAMSPYGCSKVAVELILKDLSNASNFRYVSLRYFNVAGADEGGKIGQTYRHPTHLITRALKTAQGKYDKLQIFGVDYPTKDGTCVRDYIHVSDLSEAHLLSLEHLKESRASEIYNCGYGRGYSVKDVVNTVKDVTGVNIQVEEAARRKGDPIELIADSSKIKEKLGWKPKYDSLEYIIKTSWEWESHKYNK